jgi:hypothetical protein
VRQYFKLQLPDGPRDFLFYLRPAFNARFEVMGLVPEAVDLTSLAAETPSAP